MFLFLRVFLVLVIFAFSWMLVKPIIHYNSLNNEHEKNKKSLVKQSVKPITPEKPLHNVKLPDFANISTVSEKKRQFFNFLAPAIERENHQLLAQRTQLLILQSKVLTNMDEVDINLINKLAKMYKLKKNLTIEQQINELIICIDEVPEALVLVQAANESAWGTSRFARIGLNFFGIWCYQPKCGMIPNGRSGNDKHEVAAFKSVDQAVQHYFYNINTHAAYKIFREIRRQLRAENHPLKADILASGLLAYSSRGENYVLEITKMIEQNQSYITAALDRTSD